MLHRSLAALVGLLHVSHSLAQLTSPIPRDGSRLQLPSGVTGISLPKCAPLSSEDRIGSLDGVVC